MNSSIQPAIGSLMTSDAVMDRVVDAMKDVKFEMIATNLSHEQEQKLRVTLGQG
jgi:uncharacterized membrane protein